MARSRGSDAGTRAGEPRVPEDVTAEELDRQVRAQLRSLPDGLAELVGGHLAMVARLIDDDPELALAHARAARRQASRLAVVREAVGISAYRCGEYAEALAEFRAVRRMTGDEEFMPLIADCERGLGRPEKALETLRSAAVSGLSPSGQVEALLVGAGARWDLGQDEAALLTLQVPLLREPVAEPWVARLRYGYAEALERLGRPDEAREWFVRAAAADSEHLTDALERAAALGAADSPARGSGSADDEAVDDGAVDWLEEG